MKKTQYIAVMLCITSTVLGVDLSGRFGMGVGFSPASGSALLPIDYAVTKYAFSSKIAVEPIFQYSYDVQRNGEEISNISTAFLILMDYTLKGHEQTNIYGKIGLGFEFYEPDGATDPMYVGVFPFGFGIEYFFAKRFSINVSALSKGQFTMNPGNTEGSDVFVLIGNGKPTVYVNFCWYY